MSNATNRLGKMTCRNLLLITEMAGVHQDLIPVLCAELTMTLTLTSLPTSRQTWGMKIAIRASL